MSFKYARPAPTLYPKRHVTVVIRNDNSQNPAERAAIRAVNEAAFGQRDEADLVEQLRAEGQALASIVAEVEGRIVGHLLFSRAWIDGPNDTVPVVALAPMAVLPEHQQRGIGGRLIRHGLDLLRGQGEKIVIVVGHPDYYPSFGFSSKRAEMIESPFPKNAFMALELKTGALDGIAGKVRYPACFGV